MVINDFLRGKIPWYIPDPSWPVGKDVEENVVVRTWAPPDHPPSKLESGKKDHIAAFTAITAVGAAFRHIFLPPETNAAVAPIPAVGTA